MTERTRKLLKGIAVDLAGGLLIAVGIYNFALNANFPLTGVSGICLILYRLVGLPIGLGTVLINIPIAAVCYKLLGTHTLCGNDRSCHPLPQSSPLPLTTSCVSTRTRKDGLISMTYQLLPC